MSLASVRFVSQAVCSRFHAKQILLTIDRPHHNFTPTYQHSSSLTNMISIVPVLFCLVSTVQAVRRCFCRYATKMKKEDSLMCLARYRLLGVGCANQ